ncbi:MAG: cell division protein ZapA [Bacteroidia bacterium]
MEDKLSIKVTIANRHYPLRISRAEEEGIRKSSKLINERIKEYEQSYAVTDPQDLLAMCALQFANEASSAKNRKAEMTEDQQNKTIEIEQMLDDYLNSI